MNDANDRERLFVARWSFVLFIAGFLVPFIIVVIVLIVRDTMLSPETELAVAILAVAFGVVAEVLAVILGIIGRQHLSGKVGKNGSMILLLVAVLAAVAWCLYSDPGERPPPGTPPVRKEHGERPPKGIPVQPPEQPPDQSSGDQRIIPEDAEAHINRGNSYVERGELDQAINDFTEAIRLDPNDADAYYNRGIAHQKKGDQTKAETDFAKAKELGWVEARQ